MKKMPYNVFIIIFFFIKSLLQTKSQCIKLHFGNFSLREIQYCRQTSLIVPKFAMVVKTGIMHLWKERLMREKNLDQGDLMSIMKFGRQKKKTIQKLVVKARTAALRSWAILSRAIWASFSEGDILSVMKKLEEMQSKSCKYSQTCVQWLPLGPQKSGRCLEVAAIHRFLL